MTGLLERARAVLGGSYVTPSRSEREIGEPGRSVRYSMSTFSGMVTITEKIYDGFGGTSQVVMLDSMFLDLLVEVLDGIEKRSALYLDLPWHRALCETVT